MRNPPKGKGLRVLLIDDEKKYFKELRRRHPEFRFDYSRDVDDVCKDLERRRSSGKWPDIVLLDVYWPKFHHTPESIRKARKETQNLLEGGVHPAIDEMNKVYLSAFEKWGNRVLFQIRKRFTAQQLPVIMYSSKGHFLLRDETQDWLSEAVEHNANWLCKGTVSPRAEKLIFRSMATKPTSIFIGHGRSREWQKLARFLSKNLKLQWEEFNRIATAGISTKDRLQTMLANSAIAFLVATTEDAQVNAAARARENVVHEIGLCQGKFGFERAIVMLEQGCNEFSNIHGITQIRFKKGRIEDCFKQVVGVLKREGIIAPH